ncbi:uncharacterized protein LOC144883564 [Branchiostoma floridae x Branchiostoma japonicum]
MRRDFFATAKRCKDTTIAELPIDVAAALQSADGLPNRRWYSIKREDKSGRPKEDVSLQVTITVDGWEVKSDSKQDLAKPTKQTATDSREGETGRSGSSHRTDTSPPSVEAEVPQVPTDVDRTSHSDSSPGRGEAEYATSKEAAGAGETSSPQDRGAAGSAGAGETSTRQDRGAAGSAETVETSSRQDKGADGSAGAGETSSRQDRGAAGSAGAGETSSRQDRGAAGSAGAGETSFRTDTSPPSVEAEVPQVPTDVDRTSHSDSSPGRGEAEYATSKEAAGAGDTSSPQDRGAAGSAGACETPTRQDRGAAGSAETGETSSRQDKGADGSAGAGETSSRQDRGAAGSAGAGETSSRQDRGAAGSAGAGETSSRQDRGAAGSAGAGETSSRQDRCAAGSAGAGETSFRTDTSPPSVEAEVPQVPTDVDRTSHSDSSPGRGEAEYATSKEAAGAGEA